MNSLIGASLKRLALFHQLKNDIRYNIPAPLAYYCRRTVCTCTAALDAVIKNYVVELEQVSKDSCV